MTKEDILKAKLKKEKVYGLVWCVTAYCWFLAHTFSYPVSVVWIIIVTLCSLCFAIPTIIQLLNDKYI